MTFEPLLSYKSVFRTLPYSLNDGQRTQFEALVLSADIIAMAYGRLELTALSFADFSKASPAYHAQMFMDSWTIVHEVFLVRQMLHQILKDGGGGGPIQRSFFAASKAAHDLRRNRDHLSQNVSNLSNRKGPRPAIYGTLSWFMPVGEQTTDAIPSGRITAISAGNVLPHDMQQKFSLAAGKIERPVDQFALFGFGVTFHLSLTLKRLRNVLKGLSDAAETDFRKMGETEMGLEAGDLVPLYGNTTIFDAKVHKETDTLYRYDLEIIHPSNARINLPG